MPRCTGCTIALADPDDHHALAAHVLYHLEHLEFRMTAFANDQAHLDADVQALTGIFSQLEAQIAQLKAAVAAGGPVDFAAADQLVADGKAYLAPPAAAASTEPDVSNVPSDASTVVPPTAVVPAAAPVEPATGDVSTDTGTSLDTGTSTASHDAGTDATDGSTDASTS